MCPRNEKKKVKKSILKKQRRKRKGNPYCDETDLLEEDDVMDSWDSMIK
jgi:hypothetical protein